MSSETIQEIEDAEGANSRRMDPELRTIGIMLRLLADLEECARGRVVRYLSSRCPEQP